MALQPETSGRREVPASTELAKNVERVLWAAHQRAVQLANDEPGAASAQIRRIVTARWRQAFLGMPT